MKINKSIIKAVFSLLLIGSTVTCTSNYENLNENPYDVTDEEMERDAYNISAALVGMQSWVIPTDVNTCQFIECLMGGSWGGYFADSNAGFNAGKFSTFNQPDNWNKVMMADIVPNIYTFQQKLKEATTDVVPLAIGDIIKVASYHRVVDSYGPTPYSQIGKDGKLQAPYDSQQEAYNAMFKDLDAAIAALTARRTETISSDADKIFAGSVEKWIKFANSLKLRLAMRIVYADPATAQAKAEEAVNHEVGTMTDVSDNAMLSSFGKDGNPFYKIMYVYNAGDTHVGADITTLMSSYNDPRCAAYFTKTKFTAEDKITNGYFGLRSGIRIPAAAITSKYSNANITPSTPVQWMNAAEIAFLKAEGALRGWNMGGTAESFYRQGVTLSFTQWGASGVDAYLADAKSLPQAYVDPLGTFNFSGMPSKITIAWNEAADFETNLERIITQKWIANFMISQEAWAEYRRTGYPKLMPVVLNQSAGGVVTSALGARRLAYPLDEYTTNTENVNAAVANYLNGPDNMATNVWWDCKPKN
ncbi:MAG: RagB/SusD family nutrient uptake outer membrane protein [Alistipes sp.]